MRPHSNEDRPISSSVNIRRMIVRHARDFNDDISSMFDPSDAQGMHVVSDPGFGHRSLQPVIVRYADRVRAQYHD